jgi:hypothetical protein
MNTLLLPPLQKKILTRQNTHQKNQNILYTPSKYTKQNNKKHLKHKFYYDPDTDWIFNSGVTKHIYQNCGAFTNFRNINKTIKSSLGEDAVISGAGDITINIQIGNEETLCTLRDVWYSPTTPVNLLSVRCINYVTIKDGYQIVNRKSGEVVMEGVSIGKMYTLKQSILNILYKDITEDIEQEKAFIAKVSLYFLCKHGMNDLDISTLDD